MSTITEYEKELILEELIELKRKINDCIGTITDDEELDKMQQLFIKNILK